MKLKKLIWPDKSIPDPLREEWLQTVFHRIKIRLNAMAISMVLGVLIVNILAYKLNAELFVWNERMIRFGIIVLMMSVITVMNIRARTLKQSKQTAVLAVLMILIFFTGMALTEFIKGTSFPFASLLVISIFFMGLMIPWSMKELMGVAFLHLIFNAIYYHLLGYIRTEKLQASYDFESFLETFLLVSASTIFCLSIRFQEIAKDVKSFLLLKDTEAQKTRIESLNEQVNQELTLASRVQQTLIPESLENEKISANVLYLPMSQIGGDYAGIKLLGEDRLLVMVCDVTGHGIPAALMVNRVHAEFEHLLRTDQRPGVLLNHLNRFIQKKFGETGMLLSAFCILFDFKLSEDEYCSYGHPDQFHVSDNGQTVERMKSQASLLGVESIHENVANQKISFKPSDRFILFTDGLIECVDSLGNDFGDEKIFEFIRCHATESTAEWSQKLHSSLSMHQKDNFRDDIFVVNLWIK